MKNLKYLIILFICISCKKAEQDKIQNEKDTDVSIKGIVAFVDNAPLKNDTLDVSFSDNRDTIYLTTVPLPTNVKPIDLSNVTIELEAKKSANVTPVSPFKLNLNEMGKILIESKSGTSKTYFVKAIVSKPFEVYPQFTSKVEKIWSKSGQELGLAFPGSGKGLAVSGNYLLVLDNNIDKHPNAAIRLYDKMTGAYVKNIKFYEGGWTDPRSYSWNLDTDDAGHLVMGRLNSGGAGFMLDYYNAVDGVPYILLNSTAGADLPDNTGKRFNVVGDLSAGKAYVYASAAHYFGVLKQSPSYSVWEFNDGKPVNSRPSVFTYPGAGAGWYNAVIQRESIDQNTLYVSWCNEDGYPNDHPDNWSSLHPINFQIFQPGSGKPALSINPKNFGYRMLDTKVFSMLNGKFMAMLEQSYSTGGSMKMNVFNLSDPGLYGLNPGDANHESLRIFSSAASAPTSNDGRYGHLAVGKLSDGESVVYVYFPNPDAGLARIEAYKITVTAKN